MKPLREFSQVILLAMADLHSRGFDKVTAQDILEHKFLIGLINDEYISKLENKFALTEKGAQQIDLILSMEEAEHETIH